MVKMVFTNAVASDRGFGLSVNGQSLEDLISTALGTIVGNRRGQDAGLPNFKSNCCNITVIIEPQPVTECIETEEYEWNSVEEMEEELENEYTEKIKKTDPEE